MHFLLESETCYLYILVKDWLFVHFLYAHSTAITLSVHQSVCYTFL